MSRWILVYLLFFFVEGLFVIKITDNKQSFPIRGVTIYKTMLAAREGNANAMKRIGDYHVTWNKSTEAYKQALDWYQRAAEQGEPLSMGEIGRIYMDGLAGERNYAKSRYWLEKALAADSLNYIAKANLAFIYGDGYKMYEKSHQLFREALMKDPRNLDIMWLELIVLRRENDEEGMIRLIRRMEKIKPGYVDYRLKHG